MLLIKWRFGKTAKGAKWRFANIGKGAKSNPVLIGLLLKISAKAKKKGLQKSAKVQNRFSQHWQIAKSGFTSANIGESEALPKISAKAKKKGLAILPKVIKVTQAKYLTRV